MVSQVRGLWKVCSNGYASGCVRRLYANLYLAFNISVPYRKSHHELN